MRLGGKACCSWVLLLGSVFLFLSYLHFLGAIQRQTDRSVLQQTTGYDQQYKLSPSARSAPKSNSVERYILALNYWEQLTMAMRNLFSLTCFGSLWNMSVVQPFTYNSRLYGLPNFKPDSNYNTTRNAQDLQFIFNTNSINNALHHTSFPRLVSYQSFLMRAKRELTVIHYIPWKEVHELPVIKGTIGQTIQAAFEHSSVVDCSVILDSFKQLILKYLNDEVQRFTFTSTTTYADFKIVKYFCVNMSVLTTPETFASNIKLGTSEQSESVIIVNWRGTSAQNVMYHTAKGTHLNNRVAMDSPCKNKKISLQLNTISYSRLVTKTTKTFLKSRGLVAKQYAAVHIRSEKMGLREPRFPGSFVTCLDKLSQHIETVKSKHNLSFVYITDHGPYSSDTCRTCKSGERVVKWLQRQGVQQLQFDPTEYNLPSDSGFAAAVEANVLISAKHLIVCGGGAFQTQVVSRFNNSNKYTNHDTKVLKVCTEDSDLK